MGTVVSCGGSIVESAGTSCNQLGAAPDLLSQRSHVQPPCPLATCRLYQLQSEKVLDGYFIQTKENKQVL